MLILSLWIILIIYMSVVWFIAEYLKNPSIVDVAWSGGLMLSGLWYLLYQPMTVRLMATAAALIIWGGRLGFFLWWTRVRLGEVDKRYTSLSEQWKMAKSLGFFLNFQLQGQFIFLIALPFYFISHSNLAMLSVFDIIILLMILLAVALESLADWQLEQFKQKASKGVCDEGLWAWSRHPNYFFEWLVWLGFAILALKHPWGFLGLLSPMSLYLIMVKITGPMTEAGSLKSRGDAYKNYQNKTPMFVIKPLNLLWQSRFKNQS